MAPARWSATASRRGLANAGTGCGWRLRQRTPSPSVISSSLTTVWTLRPAAGGRSTAVRIETSWQGAGGIGGLFERTFAPRALSGVHRQMLDRLDAVLTGGGPAA